MLGSGSYSSKSSGDLFEHEIPLSPSTSVNVNQWKIKIQRITPDNTVKIASDTFLDSVIIEANYSYNYPPG